MCRLLDIAMEVAQEARKRGVRGWSTAIEKARELCREAGTL